MFGCLKDRRSLRPNHGVAEIGIGQLLGNTAVPVGVTGRSGERDRASAVWGQDDSSRGRSAAHPLYILCNKGFDSIPPMCLCYLDESKIDEQLDYFPI